MVTEAQAELKVDATITKYKSTTISYYPYTSGATDVYKQKTKVFGSAVALIGRAIHRPTPEILTVIGSGEEYEIAFLFSRVQMVAKFPSALEGEWIDPSGQMEWRNRRYKIKRVAPSGQVGEKFLLMIVLANSIPGQRDS